MKTFPFFSLDFSRWLLAATLAAVLADAPLATLRAETAPNGGQQFKTPDEAVQALSQAAEAGNRKAVDAIFGPEVKDLLSGDPTQDRIAFKAFSKSMRELKHLVKKSDDRYVLDLGAMNWPMPIPLVSKNGVWFWDTAAGKDEIISRRVGEDEITAIGVCRTFVQAEREYASQDRDGSGILKYADKLKSTAGQKDGLYWPTHAGDEESPFGPLVAEARAEGYKPTRPGAQSNPFHGYLFKVLTAQGSHAPGGAFSYVINGQMIAGFALIAYPAHWGESGVMTFLVNQWGKVYQCNLGKESAERAAEIIRFDPDSDWAVVPE